MTLADLSDSDILTLPLDRLGLEVLEHLRATDEWNTYNFTVTPVFTQRNGDAQRAIVEAIGWLKSSVLIAHPKPGQSHTESMFITRAGARALAEGLAGQRASQRLAVDLHPRLIRVRPQFLLGEFELAAFAALREVEIRVRELSGAPESAIGVPLMRSAFKDGGQLADPALDGGERVGTMELYAGAIGTFKNPPSHRQVNYADPTEASEVVLLADLLLRMLDRTATRLGAST